MNTSPSRKQQEAMNFAQVLVLIITIAGMVWISNDVWNRGMPSGIAIGILFALFASDRDAKTMGIFLAIGCGIMWLFYKLMTK